MFSLIERFWKENQRQEDRYGGCADVIDILVMTKDLSWTANMIARPTVIALLYTR